MVSVARASPSELVRGRDWSHGVKRTIRPPTELETIQARRGDTDCHDLETAVTLSHPKKLPRSDEQPDRAQC